MHKFEFAAPPKPTTFTGYAFYNIYKEAEFLRNSANIETILSRGHELRQKLKEAKPGEVIKVDGMNLEKNTPLLVRKTGTGIRVEDFEFTLNRLTGLVAAYAFDNRHRFPAIQCSEATALGLTWDNTDDVKCRLYLSAVTGTEHFYEQFSFWPLICGLRKLMRCKITPELIVKMALIKNNDGIRLAKDLMSNQTTVKVLWLMFPGATANDLNILLTTASPEIKRLFVK